MLEVVDIFKTFRMKGNKSIYTLLGAGLTVEDGEKVGILGKSGEGKSTFANILCGQLSPDSGNVYLDEYPLYDAKLRYDRRAGKKIQLVPQQPFMSFDPMQKVGSAVEEVLLINERGIDRKTAKAKAEQLFERVLLDSALMDRLPSQLSGGQVQRVAIARAIAMNPDIIISDEATAMLDASSQAQIIEILNDLVNKDGISVIFITHDGRLANAFADITYRLKNGVFEVVNKK